MHAQVSRVLRVVQQFARVVIRAHDKFKRSLQLEAKRKAKARGLTVGGKKRKWRLRVPTTDSAHIWVQVLNDVAATATAGHHANASRWDASLLSSRRALEHLQAPLTEARTG